MTITLYTHRWLLLASSPRSPPAPRGCRGRGEAHRGRGDALEMGKLAEKEGCKPSVRTYLTDHYKLPPQGEIFRSSCWEGKTPPFSHCLSLLSSPSSFFKKRKAS